MSWYVNRLSTAVVVMSPNCRLCVQFVVCHFCPSSMFLFLSRLSVFLFPVVFFLAAAFFVIVAVVVC